MRRFAYIATVLSATVWSMAAFGRSTPPGFPGAEGFGAAASGGRGCEVYEVTNLDDDGPGSLRDALSRGNRTVVFRVSGTIHLKSRLSVGGSNITVAGQTAPGDGICLRGRELMVSGVENVIIRFLRLRPGDEARAEHDALSIRNSRNVIVDHCSMSWSTDSINDVTHGSGNVTVQWCILSEPLNRSVHVKGAHGYGTGWGGHVNGGGSYHHNLIAHCESRAPRIGYMTGERGRVDCRNNVIYNTGAGSAYGGEGVDLNYIGNYHRPGPATAAPAVLFDVWSEDTRLYVAGNEIDGIEVATHDNRAGLRFRKGSPDLCLVREPFDTPPVVTEPAGTAYLRVLASAGAVLPRRDDVDRRVVEDVRRKTGRIINSQDDVGGWPELKSTAAPPDADHDGMPDTWELERGLNPNDPADGRRTAPDGYTHLEHYLNALAAAAQP